MFHCKLTLSNSGGELDTRDVWVSADDMDGLRLRLIRWLEEDRVILNTGDTITITDID